jgi:hypothetical protein
MPSVTFTSPGDWDSWNKVGRNTDISPNWQTTVADAWPDDHNGDSGQVVNTLEPATTPFSLLGISAAPIDTGAIPVDATLDTFQIVFDWAIENTPDFATDATSTVGSSIGPTDAQPEGTSSGTYDETDTALNVIGSTDPADLYLNIYGWSYRGDYTGAFTGTITRRVAITNFAMTVAYTLSGPVVTDVSPTHGDKAGGTVVTLTGTGFTGKTVATFNGSSTALTVASDTSATCVAPAHAVGEVTVSVG